jgi:hypothetical protein
MIRPVNDGRLYRLGRWLEGARHPKLGGFWECHGEYVADGVDIAFAGACPVQGEGLVNGLPAYYRARGESWSLTIASDPCADPLCDSGAWSYWESPYYFPDGGWLHRDESIANIRKAVSLYWQGK